MPEVTRKAGKRGVRESHFPEAKLSQFRTSAPTPPPTGDVTQGLEHWGILGNGTYGDCGPAATEHARMAKALRAVTGGVPTYQPGFVVPTTEFTEGLYFRFGRAMGEPGAFPDQGVQNRTWLHWLWENGFIDWYAELDPKNLDEVRQAMLDCKGVLVAVALPADAEQQFEAHEPWRIDGAGVEGGHDILLVKYGPTGDTFVTWGELQEATVTWDAVCIMDAWVFGTREDAERAGYDYEAIVEVIRSAGGQVTGQPAPVPAPAPHAEVERSGFWAFIGRLLRRLA